MEVKKTTQSKDCGTKNGINFDYDYNTEYGDGDIPDVDKNCAKNAKENSKISSKNCSNNYRNVSPDEVPRRDGPGGE
ncbi:hypothetical protein [Lachnoclostridium phytofermentans]|uniref:hypothetical protein n=1 Tax=Lachnoclostridium phytofermentans TaxID=66219 RepID=UPI000496AFDF|nr:hypothetical protein [Lachnoclostridium phytofermentans]